MGYTTCAHSPPASIVLTGVFLVGSAVAFRDHSSLFRRPVKRLDYSDFFPDQSPPPFFYDTFFPRLEFIMQARPGRRRFPVL